jgi:hypothetical protein
MKEEESIPILEEVRHDVERCESWEDIDDNSYGQDTISERNLDLGQPRNE